jgi:uncharacterized protein YlxW (UPF0749 family)
MKKGFVVTLVLAVSILAGCSKNKTPELMQQVASLRNQSDSLQQEIVARDKYIDDVMRSVNNVYQDLERAKSKEATLVKKALNVEGQPAFTSAQVRQSVLKEISSISLALRANHRELAMLQHKIKNSDVKYASLNEMVENLKQTLSQREQSIAALQDQVSSLQGDVADKSRVINQQDTTIQNQKDQLNTAYYIVGSRDELKQKGIISDEGGFLWGLLGSTTVLSGNEDPSDFEKIDVTHQPAIHVDGKIEEILPRRSSSSFALAQINNKNGVVMIKHPGKFWKQKYLVIVID